jgi:hypothetical protein
VEIRKTKSNFKKFAMFSGIYNDSTQLTIRKKENFGISVPSGKPTKLTPVAKKKGECP